MGRKLQSTCDNIRPSNPYALRHGLPDESFGGSLRGFRMVGERSEEQIVRRSILVLSHLLKFILEPSGEGTKRFKKLVDG